MEAAIESTPLDKVLLAARSNPAMGEEYLNLFLNSQIFVPVWNKLEDGSNGEVNIQPVLTNNEEGEYIMAFDTKGRLEEWLDQEVGGVAALSGADILMMVKEQPVQICLNAGTEYIKVFNREEIDWIISNIKQT